MKDSNGTEVDGYDEGVCLPPTTGDRGNLTPRLPWPVDVELAPDNLWEVTGNYIMDDVRTTAVSEAEVHQPASGYS